MIALPDSAGAGAALGSAPALEPFFEKPSLGMI